MVNRVEQLFFIQILLSVFLSTGANKSCPVQVELHENNFRIIKLQLNGDEVCGCLEYRKPDVEILEKNEVCVIQTSILDGKISFSANSVCECFGYETKPNKELPTFIKTNITEKTFLQPNITFNDLKANDSESNTTQIPLTRDMSNVEKNYEHLKEIHSENKETNKTGLSTITIVENNMSTKDFMNKTVRRRNELDDDLSDEITPSSNVINFTEGLNNSILDVPAILPGANTVLNSTNTSSIEENNNANSSKIVEVLNTETMPNVNYTNDDKYVSPAAHLENSTEIRNTKSSEIVYNVLESNKTKDNLNDTNNDNDNPEKAIIDTSTEKTDDIIILSLSKNSTNVHNINDVNETLNNAEEIKVNSNEMNVTRPLTILITKDNLNKTFIFNNTFQAPLDVNDDVPLSDEVTTSSIAIHSHVTEKYNASILELPITLPDMITKLNSTNTSKPDYVTVIDNSNVLESNTSTCNLNITNVFNETFKPLEFDDDLAKLVTLPKKVTSSSITAKANVNVTVEINSTKAYSVNANTKISDNFTLHSVSNNYTELQNVDNPLKITNVTSFIKKKGYISYDDSLPNGTTLPYDYKSNERQDKGMHSLSLNTTLITFSQKYNTTTTPSMPNITHGIRDGANLYNDSDHVIKKQIVEPKVTIKVETNSSSTLVKDTLPDNSWTIIVALLGVLLAALLVSLIAIYVYTWLFERRSYDLQTMNGGQIEMGPR